MKLYTIITLIVLSLSPFAYVQEKKIEYRNIAKGWMVVPTNKEPLSDVFKDYEVGIDKTNRHEGKVSLFVSAKTSATNSSAIPTLQMLKADGYRGKRIRLTGFVKSENVESWASLWMRVDDEDGSISDFDNMQQREIKGTGDWVKCEIVLNVSEKAKAIHFGSLLIGKGKIWIDDLKLEVVGITTNATGTGHPETIPENMNNEIKDMHVKMIKQWYPTAPAKPVNMGFEN